MGQISWDKYFMNIAYEVAKRSKDPSSQNGCVIVDQDRRPVSFGYNGMIQGADESKMTLSERPMKYYFAVHSEMNALIFAHRDVKNCTLYSCIAPCENCLKHCLQAGIKRLVYNELRVKSFYQAKSSMTSVDTDEAIIRMLASMPQVESLNLATGKSYTEEILESYKKNSTDYERLKQWL